jgi:yecA family protein
MSIDGLHGYLTAICCGPELLMPSTWMPHIWGDDAPIFPDERAATRIMGGIFSLMNAILGQLADQTLEPFLPLQPAPGWDNVAQAWCLGFVEGMALLPDAWAALASDASASLLLTPLFALSSPGLLVDDPTPDPAASAELVTMLPTLVRMIHAYWQDRSSEAFRPAPARGRPSRKTAASAAGATRGSRSERNKRGQDAVASAAAATLHHLKITLRRVTPVVWRRVVIASDTKLPQVSRILIEAMGWNDTHLHAFRRSGTVYGAPDPDFADETIDERSFTLAHIAPRARSRFSFDYDFGDNWEHDVVVEAIEPLVGAPAEAIVPRCTDGARACPPDDCGGPGGYAELRRILANPKHEEYAAMRTWAGRDFAPERFDLAAVNRRLARTGRSNRRR